MGLVYFYNCNGQHRFLMDQKVVCMFLLMLGISHGLECYHGKLATGENFNATIASKVTCQDNQNVCFKRRVAHHEGEVRGCDQFQEIKKHINDLELDSCFETTDPRDGEKVIHACICSQNLCNTSTMLNGGMVLVFALMGIFMLKI